MSVFNVRATGCAASSTPQRIDEEESRRALELFVDPDAGCQLFTLPGRRKEHCPGNDLDGLVAGVKNNADQDHIYVVLNPLPIDLTDYANNAVVLRRRWLFLDIDPIKPPRHKNDPASDEEHERTREAAELVRDRLSGRGWPAPVLVDSGNGWYLLYRVDLPNDEDATQLVRRFLKAMKEVVGDKGKIDSAVSDARRIARLPGTWNRKGIPSDDRPWRPCRLVFVPKEMETVSQDAIEKVADDLAEGTPVAPTAHLNGRAKKKSPLILRAGSDGANRYVRRALELEASAVASAVSGERNNRLNRAAFSLAGYVSTGYLSQGEIEARLFDAACDCGLDKDPDCGERGIHATIQSGIAAGMKKPRTVLDGAPYASVAPSPETPNADAASLRWCFTSDDEVLAEGDPGEIVEQQDEGDDAEGGIELFRIFTLPKLLATTFPEPKWVVPGILSEGLNILAGKPKLGKSMMAFNLGMTIGGGGKAMRSIQTTPGDVLYLSLEDKERRLQARARLMVKGLDCEVSRRLSVVTQWPRLDQGGLKLLDLWFKQVACPTLVIIDVWAKFRPAFRHGGSQYEQDYQHLDALKRFVDKRGCNALVLLHCRKSISEDVLEEVSGTMGQTGAADGIIVLARSRNDNEAKIFITGRDVQDTELALMFDPPTLTWRSLGPADQHVQGKLQTAALEYVKMHPGCFTKDVALALNKEQNAIRMVLGRLMDKHIIRRIGNAWSYPGEVECDDEGAIPE